MEVKVVIRDPRLKGYIDRIMVALRGDEGINHGISLLEYRYRGYEMNDEVWGGQIVATKEGLDYVRKRVAARFKNYMAATDKAFQELGYVSIDGVRVDPKSDTGTLGEDNYL